jgi:hypothetical protein
MKMNMEVFNRIVCIRFTNLQNKDLFQNKEKISLFIDYCFIITDYYFNSYRIEYAMEGDMIQDISLKNGHLKYKEIVCAVNIHRQATKFVYSLEHFKSFCIILHKHDSKMKLYKCKVKY